MSWLRFLLPKSFRVEPRRELPFAEGHHYPGDLLRAVLKADSKFWIAEPDLRSAIARIADRAFSLLPTLEEIERKSAQDAIGKAHDVFQRAEYYAEHGRG